MMELQTLSNGRKIPVLGLGTWFIDDDKAAQAVVSAVEIGYRHIDTAQAYGRHQDLRGPSGSAFPYKQGGGGGQNL